MRDAPPAARASDRAGGGDNRYRRRRLVAAVLAGLVGLVGLGLGVRALLHGSGLADVEGVAVTGLRTLPEAEVVATAAVEPGVPLAGVDVDAVAARVAAIPEVAAVDVGRGWPHTVAVAVTERVPVAVADGTLVDASGLAYAAPRGPVDLPRLAFAADGPDDPATAAALAVLAALPGPVRAQVEAVEATGDAGTERIVLGLSGDRRVVWGGAARSGEKAAVLVALLTQPGATYDVASPELPTIRG